MAEALASRGAVRASVSLLAALAQDALLEGWLSLAAGLLFRLLEISRPLTVSTCLTITFSITLSFCCHTVHDPHLVLRSLRTLESQCKSSMQGATAKPLSQQRLSVRHHGNGARNLPCAIEGSQKARRAAG